jgi:hypothetical protein
VFPSTIRTRPSLSGVAVKDNRAVDMLAVWVHVLLVAAYAGGAPTTVAPPMVAAATVATSASLPRRRSRATVGFPMDSPRKSTHSMGSPPDGPLRRQPGDGWEHSIHSGVNR